MVFFVCGMMSEFGDKEIIMKRLLLIVLPMLLLLVQCASEDSVESMLIGKWQPETI